MVSSSVHLSTASGSDLESADRADFPCTEQTLAAKKNDWDKIQTEMLRACQAKSRDDDQVCSFQTGGDGYESGGYGDESDYPSSSDDEFESDEHVVIQFLHVSDSECRQQSVGALHSSDTSK